MDMGIEELKQKTVELQNREHDVNSAMFDLWRNHQFLTWRWWITLALFVLPLVFWFIVRKKEKTHRMFFVYLFITVTSHLMDLIGIQIRLWSYPVTLLPVVPFYIPFDFSTLPVVTLLFIQYFPNVRPVYKALVYAASASFVFQPLCEWIGIVNHERWPDYLSFVILFFMYMAASWLAAKLDVESFVIKYFEVEK